ncbi:hypothetical protein, partial [Klebsiella aerogenes]|uniref:hypothetical protein n=1 Tax=Klebsiella aerogenes TaxID=548 RepID=UPI0019535FC9
IIADESAADITAKHMQPLFRPFYWIAFHASYRTCRLRQSSARQRQIGNSLRDIKVIEGKNVCRRLNDTLN